MACPAILTGENFVLRMLTHIDCQSRYLGSYGYEALSQPGSIAAGVITSLLTLFIAFWGIRLLFGPIPTGRDVVADVLKIGIVLTLAFSWPAFRTLIHDVTLDGPAQIAASLGNPGVAPSASGFAERLQNVDNSIVELTEIGTGRRTGAFIDPEAVGGTFESSALEDESALGWARLVYLSAIFGSLALLRIVAGLLLALAPLAAGLLLFEASRGLFAGWLRGLVLTLLGALGVTMVLAIELAILEPWLADVHRIRSLGYAAPSAPIELLAMVASFAAVKLGSIWILGKVAFSRGWISLPKLDYRVVTEQFAQRAVPAPINQQARSEDRVQMLSDHMKTRIESERGRASGRLPGMLSEKSERNGSSGEALHLSDRLGTSYRRRALHTGSVSSQRRDGVK